MRQRDLILPRDPRILRFSATSAAFHSACRSRAQLMSCFARRRRQHDLGVLDAALAGVVEHLAGGQIMHQLGRAIRRSPRSPSDPPARLTGFDAQVIDRHRAPLRSCCSDAYPPPRSDSGSSPRDPAPTSAGARGRSVFGAGDPDAPWQPRGARSSRRAAPSSGSRGGGVSRSPWRTAGPKGRQELWSDRRVRNNS